MPIAKIKIGAKSESITKTRVKAGEFELLLDEPRSMGGTNEAADPLQYLLAGFAGCMNVTAHSIASEMGINLKGLDIEIEGDLAIGPLDDGKESAVFTEIRVKLNPEADACKDTLGKWAEQVEKRCAVSRTLQNNVGVKMGLK